MKISKIYLRVCSLLFVCFLVCGSILRPVVTYASPYDLMINTDSNALMTLELDDSDYLMMSPRSSVGTVINTIPRISIVYTYTNGTFTNYNYGTAELVDNRFRFSYHIPDYLDGYWISGFAFDLQTIDFGFNSLPSPSGNYNLSMDLASDFSYDMASDLMFSSYYTYKNSTTTSKTYSLDHAFSSGDFYVYPHSFNIKSGYEFVRVGFNISSSDRLQNFAGSLAVRFEPTSTQGDPLAGPDVSSSELYEDSISGSLSDLSSSVDTMTEEISGVTEAIQNLQGAMEPHYSNVLTQLHHITEQLHAFYDQIYNNIHLKEYALWQDIKTAIENIDLEVNVNLDKLKSSIDNMSQAIQNKLQSVQDTLTNGFNNSGINQDAAELDQSLQEYEEAEQTVIDQVNDSLNDFEFDSGFEEYTNTIKVFSDFIQDLYEASGGFKVVINLSLMLSIAGIVIGVYRFRDGG